MRPSRCRSLLPSRPTRRLAALAAMLALVVAHAAPVAAYLTFGIQSAGRQIPLKWPAAPVRYFVSDQGAPGVAPDAFQSAVGRAFATWQGVPTASIAYQFVGTTGALPLDEDGQSTLGFLARPDLDRVLASTSFLVDLSTGELLESDIFFNTAFRWSVAAAGESGRFDLESVALHEIGHMSGLGHSALGETELLAEGGRRVIAAEAVMFPIAYGPGNISGRSLRDDDKAGISNLYPDGGFDAKTGSISGTVTRDGRGVFGAHLVAFDLGSGSLVGNFSLNDRGAFSIAGLSPGPHLIRVEPLDDVDVDSFFDLAVNAGFRPAFFERLVVVPRGGDSGPLEIKVVPK
ncbi:MAG: matrixin family metalloprotease [Acidobacteriota bacterium]